MLKSTLEEGYEKVSLVYLPIPAYVFFFLCTLLILRCLYFQYSLVHQSGMRGQEWEQVRVALHQYQVCAPPEEMSRLKQRMKQIRKKCDITRDKKTTRGWMKTFVPLLIDPITQKDNGFGIQFGMIRFRNMDMRISIGHL